MNIEKFKEPKKVEQIATMLTKEEFKELEKRAKQNNMSMSAFLRAIVRCYLEE